MLNIAIQRAKKEQEKEIEICLNIKENIYRESEIIGNENDITVKSLYKNIIETSIDGESDSSDISNQVEDNKEINLWIISSKYIDGESDLTDECIKNSQIRIGWFTDNILSLSRIDREKAIEKIWHKKNIITNLDYFIERMKKGDFVIMKEGTERIRAIVQISSEAKEYNNEQKYYYREVKQAIIIEKDKTKDIAKLYEEYFLKSLNRTTIYRKKVNLNNFNTFLVNILLK